MRAIPMLLATALVSEVAWGQAAKPCDFERDGVPVMAPSDGYRLVPGKLTLSSPGEKPHRRLRHVVARNGAGSLTYAVSMVMRDGSSKLSTPVGTLDAKLQRRAASAQTSLVVSFANPRVSETGGEASGPKFAATQGTNAVTEAAAGLRDALTGWSSAAVNIPFGETDVLAPQTVVDQSPAALLRLAIVPLPEEPIGPGATWRVSSRIESTISLDIETEYRWIGGERGAPVIEIRAHQGVPTGQPRKFRTPDGGISRVDRLDTDVRGRVTLGRDLPFSSAELQLDMNMAMTKCRAGKEEPGGLHSEVSVSMAPPRR